MAATHDLPPIDHGRRVRSLLAELDAGSALLVTDLVDVRWLTGFTGSNGWVVAIGGEGVTLGTDGRYGDRAAAETAGSGVEVVAETSRQKLAERMHSCLRDASAVAADDSSMSHRAWADLECHHPLRPATSPIGRARQVKDAAEIARVARAAAVADAALGEVEPMLFENGVTEADLRNELEYRMRLHGADDRSYATIVATGPEHAARPHHEVTGRRLLDGDTVVIDVGALVDGYHSDMTRSWVVGDPDTAQREWYELVGEAQRAGLAALAPGVAARDVDEASRAVFRRAGVDEWFLHGTGHGVGLVIHEAPFLGAASSDVIEEGNVVTVEPGLYRGGFGGFRIEDLVVVRTSGAEILTHFPKRQLAA